MEASVSTQPSTCFRRVAGRDTVRDNRTTDTSGLTCLMKTERSAPEGPGNHRGKNDINLVCDKQLHGGACVQSGEHSVPLGFEQCSPSNQRRVFVVDVKDRRRSVRDARANGHGVCECWLRNLGQANHALRCRAKNGQYCTHPIFLCCVTNSGDKRRAGLLAAGSLCDYRGVVAPAITETLAQRSKVEDLS
jgi:hypothetical protein